MAHNVERFGDTRVLNVFSILEVITLSLGSRDMFYIGTRGRFFSKPLGSVGSSRVCSLVPCFTKSFEGRSHLSLRLSYRRSSGPVVDLPSAGMQCARPCFDIYHQFGCGSGSSFRERSRTPALGAQSFYGPRRSPDCKEHSD